MCNYTTGHELNMFIRPSLHTCAYQYLQSVILPSYIINVLIWGLTHELKLDDTQRRTGQNILHDLSRLIWI